MTQEVYVDGIGNISVQGPVVTLTLVRNQQGSEANQNAKSDVLHLTMTGQNLLNFTNILNNTLKRIAEKTRDGNKDSIEKVENTKSKLKKDKTVNW